MVTMKMVETKAVRRSVQMVISWHQIMSPAQVCIVALGEDLGSSHPLLKVIHVYRYLLHFKSYCGAFAQ